MDPNDIRPVHSYRGQELIKQNVQVKCISHHKNIQAIAKNTSEYYYCELTYTGKTQPEDSMDNYARIDVIAEGGSKDNSYSQKVLSFELELYSEINHEAAKNKNLKYAKNNRKKTFRINSLADIDIDTTECENKIV